MNTTKVNNVTYCGVPAQICEVRATGAAGLRVMVTYWPTGSGPKNGNQAARTANLRLVRGNFLKGTGQLLTKQTERDVTIEQAIRAAQDMLTNPSAV